MKDNEQSPNTTVETTPAPYNTPGQDEDTTEGRKEERAQPKHGSAGDDVDDGHGKGAQSSGRVTAQEQNAHPEPTIEAEGKKDRSDAQGMEDMPKDADK